MRGLVSLNSLMEYDDFRLIEVNMPGRKTQRPALSHGNKVTIKVMSANPAQATAGL
jgi:hypothetical protein